MTEFACKGSTLRLPKPDDNSDYPEYAAQRDARLENPAGDCKFAQEILHGGWPTYEDLVEKCPKFMTEMHEKGAPKEIRCAIELMYFCEATKG